MIPSLRTKLSLGGKKSKLKFPKENEVGGFLQLKSHLNSNLAHLNPQSP